MYVAAWEGTPGRLAEPRIGGEDLADGTDRADGDDCAGGEETADGKAAEVSEVPVTGAELVVCSRGVTPGTVSTWPVWIWLGLGPMVPELAR